MIKKGAMTERRREKEDREKDVVLQHSSPTLDSLQLLSTSPLKFHFSNNLLRVLGVSPEAIFD